MKKINKLFAVLAATLAATFLFAACNDKPDDGGKPEEPIKYTVTYTAGEGSGTVPSGGSYVAGATFELPAANGLSKEGYVFDKWSDGENTYAVGATYTMPAKNVTFAATWKDDGSGETPTPPTKYTVTFSGGEDAEGTAPTGGSYEAGATFDIPAADGLVKDGFVFVCWTYNETDYNVGDVFTMPVGNVVFTAKWEAEIEKKPDFVFESEDAKLKDGDKENREPWAYVGTENVEDQGVVKRVVAKGFSENPGATITYNFTVGGESGTTYIAQLVSTNSSLRAAANFTDVMKVTVNGNELTSKAVIPQYSPTFEEDQPYFNWHYVDLVLGNIELKGGAVNTIVFEVIIDGSDTCCNFDKITLRDLTVDVSKLQTAVFEAENAALKDGNKENLQAWEHVKTEDVKNRDGEVTRKAAAGFSGNPGATMTFTLNVGGEAGKKYTAELISTNSSLLHAAAKFSDIMKVTVNGVDIEINGDAVIPKFQAYSDKDKPYNEEYYVDLILGSIELNGGSVNTIVFTVIPDGDDTCCNFDKITLRDLAVDVTAA